ncbi:MAG TPA: 2-hydroxychromene-2-carboxylate isomerase [Aliiroseovarius sp.]|nr:2-hydroxychromene-2-carboxylate isomerase [Aliiroseovarius sp.]
MKPIDFWFSIGSTYSYLTVMRLDAVAAREGVTINWRVFNVREMMIAQDNTPFATKPAKAAYMWRDIERRLGKYGLNAQLPAPYPLENLALANQVALVGLEEGWGKAYVFETYRRWFQRGQMAGSEPNLSASLIAVDQDPERVMPLAESAATEAALAAATGEATSLGLFGVPSFVVDGELFWGDDRLEDAISWARLGRVI